MTLSCKVVLFSNTLLLTMMTLSVHCQQTMQISMVSITLFSWLSALLKQVGSEGALLSVARSPRVRSCHLILIGEEGTEALAG